MVGPNLGVSGDGGLGRGRALVSESGPDFMMEKMQTK